MYPETSRTHDRLHPFHPRGVHPHLAILHFARLHLVPLRLAFPLVLAAAGLAVTLAGCGDDKKTNPPPAGYPAATSPSICLENLRDAYQAEDYAEYARLFDNDFVFLFRSDDVSDPDNPTPPSWSRDEELQSASKMFADSTVDRIDLSWSLGDSTTWTDLSPEGLKVRANGVYLAVSTRNEQGEPLYLVVQGAVHIFYFLPESPSSGGARLWKIRLWEDSPIGGKTDDLAKVERTSWGQVKVYYR